jgi:hypothetical protein
MPTDGEGMEGRDTDGRSYKTLPHKLEERLAMGRKLRELLEKWRRQAVMCEHPEIVRKRVLLACIENLREVLDGKN